MNREVQVRTVIGSGGISPANSAVGVLGKTDETLHERRHGWLKNGNPRKTWRELVAVGQRLDVARHSSIPRCRMDGAGFTRARYRAVDAGRFERIRQAVTNHGDY